jgi:hypothetical protein
MKYYMSYLQPGEFGNEALWGVSVKFQDGREGWCAFYKTRDEALKAYPEAVCI